MAQIEYDESGANFSYFLLSAYAFFLIPASYFLWPRADKQEGESTTRPCQCDGCARKRHKLDTRRPRKTWWRRIRYMCLTLGWLLFVYLLYRTITMEIDVVEYDPYEILEIDRGAGKEEIRKKYRQLSLRYHPDKDTGDQDKFMRIAKAYEALTDEESRKNWEEYGNPDGPRATSFGIALPSWMVSQESSIWVLVVYVAVFMVALPTIVGVWWYRSIKYSSANVLMDTQNMFMYCLSRKATLDVKVLVMILTSSLEFSSRHNNKVKDRATDDEQLSKIIATSLPQVNMKVQQPPYCHPYARKSRALVHAHLHHVSLPDELAEDQEYILTNSGMLLQEMISVLKQVGMFATWSPRKGVAAPSVDTYEGVMKVAAMITQSLWDNQSPLLQLPHVTSEHLRHFNTRKRHITTVENFAALPSNQRRKLLKTLTDQEYSDILAVLREYPHLDVTVDTRVLDDEEQSKITGGCLVTIDVEIVRTSLLGYYGDVADESSLEQNSQLEIPAEVSMVTADGATVDMVEEKPSNGKGWEKQRRKKKSKQPVVKGKKKKAPKPLAATSNDSSNEKLEDNKEKQSDEHLIQDTESDHSVEEDQVIRRRVKEPVTEDDDVASGDSEADDDDEWNRLQLEMKQQKPSLAPSGPSSCHRTVHAPSYPEEKQEQWWVYVCDRKKRTMVAYPEKVFGLREQEKIQLQFPAPAQKGTYHYTVVVRSDSYLDTVVEQPLKLEVHEAAQVKTDQWKELEQEEAEDEAFEETDSEEESDPQSSD